VANEPRSAGLSEETALGVLDWDAGREGASRCTRGRVRSPESMRPRSGAGGFTLVELLVALALMAVVIPVVYQGLKIATLAGEVSERKTVAARVAERVLNETIVNGQILTATSGSEMQGPYQFRWTIKNEPWTQLAALNNLNNANSVNVNVVNQTLIHQLSVTVTYQAQGRDYTVHLSTLVNNLAQ
jgi:prepilin-type N-terminal cleavage/methylation domain-containing protein